MNNPIRPWAPSLLVSSFHESATLALSSRAKEMASGGRSIINCGVGEPDFPTPESLIQAAFEAAKNGATKYTAVGGMLSLRQAIAKRVSEDYGIFFSAEETMASCGGKQAIYHFLQSVLEPMDEVLILSPYWVSFPEMVKMVGAKPVIVRSPDGRVKARDVEKAITAKTRLFILNSPSNPSGTVFLKDETASFMDVIERHPIWLLSDDTYYKLVYGENRFVSALSLRSSFRERTCVVGSTSKSYAMTGWRLGWALAPKAIIDAMIKLQSQVTSNPSSLAQAAALEALTHSHTIADDFQKIFDRRRRHLIQELASIHGLRWMEPEGAFYIFVHVGSLIKDSVHAFSKRLLETEGLCVIPGEAFGEPDYIRLSYALSEKDLSEAVKRLKHGLSS